MRRSRTTFLMTLALGAVITTAALAAKPALTCYFPVNFKDAAYQKSALGKVLKAWAVPGAMPAAGEKTVVQSTIGRDGKLIAAIVTLGSGVEEWDAAALAAVKKSSPFGALPKGFPEPQIEVHWHFSANR